MYDVIDKLMLLLMA